VGSGNPGKKQGNDGACRIEKEGAIGPPEAGRLPQFGISDMLQADDEIIHAAGHHSDTQQVYRTVQVPCYPRCKHFVAIMPVTKQQPNGKPTPVEYHDLADKEKDESTDKKDFHENKAVVEPVVAYAQLMM